MVLRLETKDLGYGKFFDHDTATTGLPQDKAIRPEFTFGFDLHWWGEKKEQYVKLRHCPIKELRKELQVSHNVQALGGSIPAFDATNGTKKSHRTEFRKKVLNSSDWFFKDHECSIHDIQIKLREAIGDTIFLRAELVAEAHEQSDCCCTSVRAGGVGRWLRIRVRYSTEQCTVERCVELAG